MNKCINYYIIIIIGYKVTKVTTFTECIFSLKQIENLRFSKCEYSVLSFRKICNRNLVTSVILQFKY